MGFIEFIDSLHESVKDNWDSLSDDERDDGFNPNLGLLMPKVRDYYKNNIQSLYLCSGNDLSGMGKYLLKFVDRLDYADINEVFIPYADDFIKADVYSKSLIKNSGMKYNLIIAVDASHPLRDLNDNRRLLREKTLINNIRKLLKTDGVAIFEYDVSKEFLKKLIDNFKVIMIGDKLKLVIAQKQ